MPLQHDGGHHVVPSDPYRQMRSLRGPHRASSANPRSPALHSGENLEIRERLLDWSPSLVPYGAVGVDFFPFPSLESVVVLSRAIKALVEIVFGVFVEFRWAGVPKAGAMGIDEAGFVRGRHEGGFGEVS